MKPAILALAVVLALLGVVIVMGGDGARAHFPHAGLNFAIGIDTNGDTADDCNTDTEITTCVLGPGAPFKLRFYLADNGGVSYDGYDAVFVYAGVTAQGSFDGVSDPGTWPNCQFFATSTYFPGLAAIMCASQTSSSYIGSMATVDFTCTASGTISMVHGEGNTELVAGYNHGEAASGAETLTIDGCGVAPTGTPTATPTSTPTPTITDTPEPVTPTPTGGLMFVGIIPVEIPICVDMFWAWCGTPTANPTATETPSSTPLATDTPAPSITTTPEPDERLAPTSVPALSGDVDGDGDVTSKDAVIVLAYGAGFVGVSDTQLGSLTAADVHLDGKIDSLDALIVLQIDAGLLS